MDNQEESWFDVTSDERCEEYSNFLEEGDFEYFQPCCYMDRNTSEFKRKLLRALWIINRFTEWKGTDWKQINVKRSGLYPDVVKYKWQDL